MDEITPKAGFTGFVRVPTLRAQRLHGLPERPGVYAILWPSRDRPDFLRASPAGWFKGRDPTLPVEELARAWVPGTPVLYVGKAGGAGVRSGMRTRLRTYLAHGAGRRAGHWGGRAVWQIEASEQLLVAWRVETCREPREVERELLAAFEQRFGRRPFANRTG